MNQQSMAGMGAMTDQVIATDFLFATKSDIKMIARAITESATPEVRETLTQYLNDSIDKHQAVTEYMMGKGFYHPYNLTDQLNLDLRAAKTAQNQANNNNKQ
ncbi:spore coat protein [Bacillus sp. T33-2]|uniref:spore coat protein n=1 Tax=Bacillus sp. T33-2 TaxID=2054168 RepID=UPI000C775CFD|nr:spore coat protein [Bacillus sp. T33-2]PLR89780.1 spore coat protein [Bacillus sp. T33-2]